MTIPHDLIAIGSLWAAQMGPPAPPYVPAAARALNPSREVSPGQERHLIAKYQSGDRRAGEALLRLHDKALRTATWKRRGQGDPLDLLQEARLELLEHAARFDLSRERGGLMAYAHKGIHGRVLRCATKETARKRREVSIDEPIGENGGRTIADFLYAASNPEAILLAFEDFRLNIRSPLDWRPDGEIEEPDGRAEEALDLVRRL